MTDKNGNYISYKWLVGILVAIVVSGSGTILAMRSQRVDVVEKRVQTIEQEHPQGFERISSLEARASGFDKSIEAVDKRLERIENKLDRLLSR